MSTVAQDSRDESLLDRVSRAITSLTPSSRRPRDRKLVFGEHEIQVRDLDVSESLASEITPKEFEFLLLGSILGQGLHSMCGQLP